MRNKVFEQEDGVVIGNIEAKEHLSNPIPKRLVEQFDHCLLELVRTGNPSGLHEVG
ncbi:hypothetical protein ACFL1S_00250 [Pseudomonadota bacterium]